jgi:predicted Holliday junction resolvase-like endonuclease
MSLNESNEDDFIPIRPECLICEEREKTSVTVDSMIKWISSLEDKVSSSSERIERMLSTLIEQQELLRSKNTELVRCNRELAVKLSEVLFRKEFKARKLTNPLAEEVVQGALHPKVIPFVYLEKSELSVASRR